MTVHLDRFRLLLKPDISSAKIENLPLNPNDKFRSLKILNNEQLRTLDHNTKNTLRLIIEIFGLLIPDPFVVRKASLNNSEVCVVLFSDNCRNVLPDPLSGAWINDIFIKCKLPRLALCVYAEINEKKSIWYITEGCLAIVSNL